MPPNLADTIAMLKQEATYLRFAQESGKRLRTQLASFSLYSIKPRCFPRRLSKINCD